MTTEAEIQRILYRVERHEATPEDATALSAYIGELTQRVTLLSDRSELVQIVKDIIEVMTLANSQSALTERTVAEMTERITDLGRRLERIAKKEAARDAQHQRDIVMRLRTDSWRNTLKDALVPAIGGLALLASGATGREVLEFFVHVASQVPVVSESTLGGEAGSVGGQP